MATSLRNQASSAILFLYRDALHRELGFRIGALRTRPRPSLAEAQRNSLSEISSALPSFQEMFLRDIDDQRPASVPMPLSRPAGIERRVVAVSMRELLEHRMFRNTEPF